MSRAEQIGEYALESGVKTCTMTCWRCEGGGDLVHHTFSEHGNLEEKVSTCDECGGDGEIVPHWSHPHVQLFVLSAVIGGMNECKSNEDYVTAWDLLDWGLGFVAKCFEHTCSEIGPEKALGILQDMGIKMGTPPEPKGATVTAEPLTQDELEELLKS